MQVQIRGNVVHLVRSTYTRLDRNTGVGGRVRTKSFAKFPADSTEVPLAVASILSAEELEKVIQKAIAPACERAKARALEEEARLAAQEAHAKCADWRIENAIAALNEGRSVIDQGGPLPQKELVIALHEAAIRTTLATSELGGEETTSLLSSLAALRHTISLVANAIEDATFPESEAATFKDCQVNNAWGELSKAVVSLRYALQIKGYVQKRSGG